MSTLDMIYLTINKSNCRLNLKIFWVFFLQFDIPSFMGNILKSTWPSQNFSVITLEINKYYKQNTRSQLQYPVEIYHIYVFMTYIFFLFSTKKRMQWTFLCSTVHDRIMWVIGAPILNCTWNYQLTLTYLQDSYKVDCKCLWL